MDTSRLMRLIRLLGLGVISALFALAPASASEVVAQGHRLLIVDSSVPDAEELVRSAPDYEVVRIAPGGNPLEAIARAGGRIGSISSLAILSHGSAGGLSLGGHWIDAAALEANAEALGMLRGALSDDADILLYGCDVAASPAGQAFVDTLAKLTGANVAASTDATGGVLLGADWDLEYATAPIRTAVPFAAAVRDSYAHTLSHFRGGAITWQIADLDNDGQSNDVLITVKTAWRYNSINSVSSLASSPALTITQLSEDRLYVNGDATLADYALQTTVLEARNLDPNTHYSVSYTGCCRISSLLNNADGDWNIQADLYLKDGNLAPKIDLPIIFQVPQLQSDGVTTLTNWTFDVGSTDPNADKLRYRLANLSELGGGGSTNPNGLSINPNTGLLTWSNSGNLSSGLYSGGLVAEDVDTFGNVKSKSHVDFILDLQPTAAVEFTLSSNIPETRNVRVEKGTTYSFSLSGAAVDTQSLGDVQGALSEPTDNNFVFDPGPDGSGLIPATYPITFEIRDTNDVRNNSYLTLNFIVPDPNAPQIANLEGDRTVYAGTATQLVDSGGDATVSDADDTQFNGGQLKFNVTFTDGQYEVLSIQSVGDGAGQIRVDGSDVYYEGQLFGVIDSVENGVGRALKIDFTTTDATIPALEALIHSLLYQDTFTLRAPGDRDLSLFIKDPAGHGNAYEFFIDIQAHPSAPSTGAPLEAANELTIVEGSTISLSDENLNYADPDGGTITFTASNVQNGQFEFVASPGTPITTFTQTQVTLGQIAFAHDGSELAPSYAISADDGVDPPTAPAEATISFANVADHAPVLGGSPATVGYVDVAYTFTPTVSDDDQGIGGTIVSFSIANPPSWATFDTVTGTLSGSPGTGDTGVYSNIVITATDDGGLDGDLPAFSITVSDPCTVDPNGAACLGLDSDGDGVTNGDEDSLGLDRNNSDTDGDGVNDGSEVGGNASAPSDSDGDGVIDALESTNADQDGDGVNDQADFSDANPCFPNAASAACAAFDSDGDGLTNEEEADLGTDPNTADSDGDGSADGVEVGDVDNPTDSDGDGIIDALETNSGDRDGDGVPDAADSDSDNDGIADAVEIGMTPTLPVDTDGDSVADYLDFDSDDDGIPDAVEGCVQSGVPCDSDGDGAPDYGDLDSDNDGVPDRIEDGLANADADGDDIDDRYDADFTGGADANLDGVDDLVFPRDRDADGTPNYLDLDSDNDGIPDGVETGMTGLDSDSDGIDDAIDPQSTGGPDLDGDGIDDNYVMPDSDSDGVPDVYDLDSDNDGIADAVEAGLLDVDGDGMADAGQTLVTTPPDTDGDGMPDYLDLDSDEDGTFDIDEAGLGRFDQNGDGRIDASADADADGIPDSYDGDPNGFGNWLDTDGDGVPDNIDADIDNDGIPNELDGIDIDSDGDGIPNAADLDSDNDGLPDLIEAGGVDSDHDGRVDTFLDADGDGLADSVDADQGGSPLPVPDTDGDGAPNHIDVDSDGDGIMDLVEAGGVDADGNGRVDTFVDVNHSGLTNSMVLIATDTDGDGVPDVFDTDSDGDGFPDSAEGMGDVNGNGVADRLESPEQIKTAVSGGGTMDFWLIAILGLLLLGRRWRQPSGGHSVVPLVLIVLASSVPASRSDAQPIDAARRDAPWSVGIDMGLAKLDPAGTGTLTVTDSRSTSLRVAARYDWSAKWTFEGFYVDAGAARIGSRNPAIGDVGDLEYRVMGFGAKYRFLPNVVAGRLAPYVGAGIAARSNHATDPRINYDRVHKTGAYLTVGSTWQINRVWWLTTELSSYSHDASLLGFGINRRLRGIAQ